MFTSTNARGVFVQRLKAVLMHRDGQTISFFVFEVLRLSHSKYLLMKRGGK